jgi:hypothetical protein
MTKIVVEYDYSIVQMLREFKYKELPWADAFTENPTIAIIPALKQYRIQSGGELGCYKM